MGTLTRKIGRHEVPAMSALTSRPPTSWPTTAAMPDVAPYRARARALRSCSSVWWKVASTCGTSSAAVAPWTMRAAIRTPTVGAKPQASRGQHEADERAEEEAAAAEAVAEPAAEDQEGGVRDAVPGDHQLERGRRGVQGGVDARQRDVGDEEVHDRQEGAGQQEEHSDRVQPAGQRDRTRRAGAAGLEE